MARRQRKFRIYISERLQKDRKNFTVYRYKPDKTGLQFSLELSDFLDTLSVTFHYKII